MKQRKTYFIRAIVLCFVLKCIADIVLALAAFFDHFNFNRTCVLPFFVIFFFSYLSLYEKTDSFNFPSSSADAFSTSACRLLP